MSIFLFECLIMVGVLLFKNLTFKNFIFYLIIVNSQLNFINKIFVKIKLTKIRIKFILILSFRKKNIQI